MIDSFDISFCLGLFFGNILIRVFVFEDTILSGVIVGLIASIIFVILKRFIPK